MPLYFVAIVAPAAVNEQVRVWKQYMLDHFNCRVALRSPAHITLIPPFHLQKEQEGTLMSALDHCKKNMVAFDIMLKDFAAFKPRVIYVDVVPDRRLTEVKRSVEELLYESGFPIKKETRPFHPHVTLANRDLKREDFPKAWEYFSNLKYEATFSADNISLLRSGQGGWEIVRGEK